MNWCARSAHEDSTQYNPSNAEPLERELILVYFGSAAGGQCNDPGLPGVIDSTEVAVREHAKARRRNRASTGTGKPGAHSVAARAPAVV